MAYSMDLRVRVVDAYERGMGTIKQVAGFFSISPRTLDHWLARKRLTGSVARSGNHTGRKPKLDQEGREELQGLLKDEPDALLKELCESIERSRGVRLSASAMCRTLQKMEVSRKKNSRRPGR